MLCGSTVDDEAKGIGGNGVRHDRRIYIMRRHGIIVSIVVSRVNVYDGRAGLGGVI
jgi:hypothetical protein